jgi:hypothetical protein
MGETQMEVHTTGLLKRGLGPFTSRQLTLLACVAIVSVVVIIPTAALAAVGTFTSSTAAPAVTAVNASPAPNAVSVLGRAAGVGNAARVGVVGSGSGANGVGVRGTGAKFGVLSNGPLGVAGTNQLTCTKCVTAADVANRIEVHYNLAAGANSAPVTIPANRPVAVMGVQTNIGFRGVASATLLRIPNSFIEWTGLESPSTPTGGSAVTAGYNNVTGTHIVYIDYDHVVDIQVNDANSIRIHNGDIASRSGVVVITW